MVIAGSTFVGADWSSGSLTNQLIFEPRRLRLWLAKAVAVVIGSGVVTLVALTGYWLGVGAVAQARDLGHALRAGHRRRLARRPRRRPRHGRGLGAFALTADLPAHGRHPGAAVHLQRRRRDRRQRAARRGRRPLVGRQQRAGLAGPAPPLLRRHDQLHAGRALQLDAGDDPPRVGHLPRHPAARRGGDLARVVPAPRRLSGLSRPAAR